MSRRRDRKGLQVARGERYALIPREVLESEAYLVLPAWTIVVLLALAVQYYGRRNGSLALPWEEAHTLGVAHRWQLYAGLRLLEATELVQCCRRGYVADGRTHASLYALTWRPIDEPGTGPYDANISTSPTATHAWARWKRPDDWREYVREITDRARGAGNRTRARKRLARAETHGVGIDRTPTVGTRGAPTVPTAWVADGRVAVPTVGVTSEISGLGARGARDGAA